MAQRWDGGDIAFRSETWATVASVMRPGAFLLAFGGTRTYHRMACAIEDAGFVIQDTILWLYGCLSEDTHLVTPNGTTDYKTIMVGDPILCYDLLTSEYSWQPVLEVFEYDISDTVFRVHSDSTDQLVTRNHRCIVERGGTETFECAEALALERAARLPILEDLQGLLNALRDPHHRTGQSEFDVWSSVQRSADKSAEERKDNTLVGKEGETDPVRFLRQGSMEARCVAPQSSQAYMQSILSGTLVRGASASGGAGDRTYADESGVRSSRQPQAIRQSPSQLDAVQNKPRSQAVRGWRGHHADLVRITTEAYQGKVWCVRVPTGAFVAVRNGKAFPTGNSGFPKGRSQLKPSYEPICVAYKPGGKRELQIDECLIDGASGDGHWTHNRRGGGRNIIDLSGGRDATDFGNINPRGGRWPANICHDGSDEVMQAFAAFYAPGQQGDLTGDEPSECFNGVYSGPKGRHSFVARRDGGSSPARFFYSSKADVSDRWGSKHPTVKPIELLKWLVPLVTLKDGWVLDCFAGSGTTGVGALATGRNAILVEREAEYISDIRERLAFYEGEGRHSLAAKNRNRRADRKGSLL
jgi:hypothetical protein